jgi:TrmH family RNA methyltransferase
LFVTDVAARRDTDLLRTADAADIRVTLVSDSVVTSLCDTVTPQGVVAVVTITQTTLDELLRTRPTLLVAINDAADPGNVGTVIRVADAAGADGVLLVGRGVDPHNPKTVRASAGSIFHLPLVRCSVAEATKGTQGDGLRALAATADGETDLFQLAEDGGLSGPLVWWLGNEAHGLSAPVLAAADARVRIPIAGKAESLNLATAAAVCLYTTMQSRRRAR